MKSSDPVTSQLAAAQRARFATMIAFFINGSALATWAANIPSVQEHLQLTDKTLGLALTAVAVGSVLAILVAGRLIARFGSRAVTTAPALLLILFVPALIAAPNLPLLVVALFFFGVSGSVMDVAMNAHGVLVERQLERPVLSSLHALWSVGALAAAGVTALLLKAGVTPLGVALLIAAVQLIAALLSLPRMLPGHADRRAPSEPRARFVRPTALLLGVSAMLLLSYVAEGAISDWSAVYLRGTLRLDRGLAVGGLVAFNTAMVAARLIGDYLRAALSPAALLAVSGIVAAIGMTLALLASGPVLAFFGFALTGLGFSNVVPALFSATGHIPGVPPATAVATAAGAGYAGFLIGPPVIGLLAGASSLRDALVLIIVFAALIALGSGVLRRTTTDEATLQPENH